MHLALSGDHCTLSQECRCYFKVDLSMLYLLQSALLSMLVVWNSILNLVLLIVSRLWAELESTSRVLLDGVVDLLCDLFIAKVRCRLAVSDLSNSIVRRCGLSGFVRLVLLCCFGFSANQEFGKIRLQCQRSTKTNDIASSFVDSLAHGVCGSEPSSDCKLGCLDMRTHAICELNEESFTTFCALLLVRESHAFVGTARQLDQVNPGCLEFLASLAALLLAEATFDEVLRVDLDREQELVVLDLLLDALDDLKQDTGPVLQGSTVLVCSLVNLRADELAEQVSVLKGRSCQSDR